MDRHRNSTSRVESRSRQGKDTRPIMNITTQTNKRKRSFLPMFLRGNKLLLLVLCFIGMISSSKLPTSQAFTSVQPIPAHSSVARGQVEAPRMAKTANGDDRINEEPEKDLGRFFKVKPEWEGSSYNYVRPSKQSHDNVTDTKEHLGNDTNTTDSTTKSGRHSMELEFPNCGRVRLWQDPSRVADHGVSGTGHTLWSSAIAIASYLDKEFGGPIIMKKMAKDQSKAKSERGFLWDTTETSYDIKGNIRCEDPDFRKEGGSKIYWPTYKDRRIETCLEIGARLGLPSIVAARHGCEMIVTDSDADMDGLKESVALNLADEYFEPWNVRITPLDWTRPHKYDEAMRDHETRYPPLFLPPDMIIASDVMWNATRPTWPDFFALLNKMREFCHAHYNIDGAAVWFSAFHEDPVVLLGYTQRRLDMTAKEEREFFDLLRESGMQAKPIPSASSDNWPLTVLYELSWVDKWKEKEAAAPSLLDEA